ncbi:hypothetical protein Tco_0126646 [Tanacetum coccineum]
MFTMKMEIPARSQHPKQALGYLKDGDGDGNSQPHKGVKASANSDVMYLFTSAQDGDPLQDDVRLYLGDDLKKAQDHSQRHAYGYIRNHKKTVKNGQARTRESEEYKKKPKNQSRSQKSQASVKSSQNGQTMVNKSQPIKDKTQKHSIFTLQVSPKSKNNPSPPIGP